MKADEAEAQNSLDLPKGAHARSRPGKAEAGLTLDLQVLSVHRGSSGVSPAIFLQTVRTSALRYGAIHRGRSYRILVSGGLRNLALQVSTYPHSLLSSSKEQIFLSWTAVDLSGGGWRLKDPERLVHVILSAKPFKVP